MTADARPRTVAFSTARDRAPVYYVTLTAPEPFGSFLIAGTEEGLCWSGFGGEEALVSLSHWIGRHGVETEIRRERTPLLRQAADELEYFFAGRPVEFTVPLELWGTEFQRTVWSAVRAVPYGTTATYAEIAARIGRPRAARAVGAANGANPLSLFVPCHRLVGSDGRLHGYGGGLPRKAALLALEAGATSRDRSHSARR